MINVVIRDTILTGKPNEKFELAEVRNMLPTREEAERLLKEAEKCNPGPWGNHCRVTAGYIAKKDGVIGWYKV